MPLYSLLNHLNNVSITDSGSERVKIYFDFELETYIFNLYPCFD